MPAFDIRAASRVPAGPRRGGAAPLLAGALLMLGACATVPPPPDTWQVPAAEVTALYSGMTWSWGEGGAYFARDGGFIAFTPPGYGQGQWTVGQEGQICFKASWVAPPSLDYRYPSSAIDTTCFAHRTDGRIVYQSKKPAGPWYVFKHPVAEPGDEYMNFAPGDQVSARVAMMLPLRVPE